MKLEDRIDKLAAPAFRDFLAADRRVRQVPRGDTQAVEEARTDSMRAARQATAELHRLADAANADRPPWLPSGVTGVPAVRTWVQQQYCRALRGGPSRDLDLLDDIENAFKHVTLWPKKTAPRRITSDRAVVSSETGFGVGAFGEGVFGGAEQMIVTTNDGSKRALSAILQNVLDAWTLAIGRQLPAMEE
jgi:hypothetical protein